MPDPSNLWDVNDINVLHQLAKKARAVPGCINMILGEPEMDRPSMIVEAEADALRHGFTAYADNQGLPGLRAAISDSMKQQWRISYRPDDILVTAGAKEALALAAMVVAGPRHPSMPPKRILTFGPLWPGYNGMGMFSHARLEPVSAKVAGMRNGMSASLLEDYVDGKGSAGVCGILVNSPNNPTGEVIEPKEQERILSLARELDVIVIADGVYNRFVFDDREFRPFACVAGSRPYLLEIDSSSKSYKMTGSRVGWMYGPEEFIHAATVLHANLMTCVSAEAQEGVRLALEADARSRRDGPVVERGHEGSLTGGSLTGRWVGDYQRRRDHFFDALSSMAGFNEAEQVRPQGTFFAWVDISGFADSSCDAGSSRGIGGLGMHPMGSRRYCDLLLDEFGVAVAPGAAFGREFDDHVRYSLTISDSELEVAIERHRAFARKYGGK